MLTAVKARPEDKEAIAYVHFKRDAEAILGGRVVRTPVTYRACFENIDNAHAFAKRLTDRAIEQTERQTSKADPRPTPFKVSPAGGGGYRVGTFIFTFAQDSPIGRSFEEACTSPLGHHARRVRSRTAPAGHADTTPTEAARWRTRDLQEVTFRDFTAQRTVTTTPRYKRRSTIEKRYKPLLQSGAGTLVSNEDGTFHIEAVWFKLPPVQIEAGARPLDLGENYDMWGNWHPDEIALPAIDRFAVAVEEGSGRSMGD